MSANATAAADILNLAANIMSGLLEPETQEGDDAQPPCDYLMTEEDQPEETTVKVYQRDGWTETYTGHGVTYSVDEVTHFLHIFEWEQVIGTHVPGAFTHVRYV